MRAGSSYLPAVTLPISQIVCAVKCLASLTFCAVKCFKYLKMEDNVVTKKQRVEDSVLPNSESTLEKMAVKAAEIISFIFHSPSSSSSSSSSFPPLFTHQIFDNEMLLLFNPEVRVQIHVSTVSWKVFIAVLSTDRSSADFKSILSQLEPHFIPNTVSFGLEEDIEQWTLKLSSEEMKPWGIPLPTSPLPSDGIELRLSTHASDPQAAPFLQVGEKLARWFIETADSIDFTDPHFELIVAWKEGEKEKERSIAGYLTLFTFINPFCGNKLRICQALMLPIYQSQGIGRRMLLSVYKLAASRLDITEVTVEDPADGFSK